MGGDRPPAAVANGCGAQAPTMAVRI